MSRVTAKVMTTVNAPYGALVDAAQLSNKLMNPKSALDVDCSVFAFLSEVSPKLQHQFIDEKGVDEEAVSIVAKLFSDLAGYKLALSA